MDNRITQILLRLYKKMYYKKRVFKYRHYKPAASWYSMKFFCDWIKQYSLLDIENIFEIGANYGQDAEFIAMYFGVPFQNVYMFEAHPQIASALTRLHPDANIYNLGVYNKKDKIKFTICKEIDKNTGVSSFFGNELIPFPENITIDTIRMDDFMLEHNIDKIDFLKIDVEGADYAVLEGFGERINDIRAIHIEAQISEYWEGQKLFSDIEKLLMEKEFIMVYFDRATVDSNSFWVKSEYIK